MNKKEEVELPDFCNIAEDKKVKESDDYYYRVLNKQRHILLYNDIDQELAENIVTKIYVMNLESQEPIFVEINSKGGDVDSGIAIINAIKHSKAPVTTIINGTCDSMAAMISIFGHKRGIYANSTWMQHPTATMVADDVSKIQDRTQYLIKAEHEMEKMLRAKTKLNGKDLLKIRHGELWLNAKECKLKGVVDFIIR
jgi:ATP-dependent Clp protease, protease subunit